MALVAQDLNSVNSVILDRMQSQIPLIPELAGHLIAGGGKQLRGEGAVLVGDRVDVGRVDDRERAHAGRAA